MKSRDRQSRPLTVSNSRWMAYATAGLATASAGAISADGAIHYSGVINYKFEETHGGVFKHVFPLSQGAFLSGAHDAFGNGDSSATFVIGGAAVSNAFRAVLHTVYSSSPAAALPRKVAVSHGDFGFSRGSIVGRMQGAYCEFPGWLTPATHYVGFRFDTGAGRQYGWIRIKWEGCTDTGQPQNAYVVKDYAWGDPGDKVKTGQTQLSDDAPEAAPQPANSSASAPPADSEGSLGLLALGGVGLQALARISAASS